MTYVWWWHDTYSDIGSDRSLEALAGTGTNWVSLIVTWYQNDYSDTSIFALMRKTPSDDSVVHAIRTIHSLGMKVMLKPHVDLANDVHGEWRGNIEPKDTQQWFTSYRSFILHYVQLAQAERVEQFSVGTELVSMTLPTMTQYWTDIIAAVRESYNGTLVYSANSPPAAHQQLPEWKNIRFWDKLDYVGIDAYFPLTAEKDPPLTELIQAYKQYLDDVESWQKTVNKPILFTEIGWWSVAGTNTVPWLFNVYCGPDMSGYDPSKCRPDQSEQANLYEATLETFWGRPWFQGIFWWAWFPFYTLYGWGEGGPSDTSYSPHNKLAEKVLRSWYAKSYIPQGVPDAAVPALIAIQQAENTTAGAMREDRTRGLDSAKSLLSQSIAAYNKREFQVSEDLAKQSSRAAEGAVNQEKYNEAASGINETLVKLNSVQNATLQSPDAILLRQQAQSEYNLAVSALSKNDFDLVRLHASNATELIQKAFNIESTYQAQRTALQQQRQRDIFEYALVIAVVLVPILLLLDWRNRKKASA
jgi:hypothetical protein